MESMLSRLSSTVTWPKAEWRAGTFEFPGEDLTCHLALAHHISVHLSGFYVMQESSHLQTKNTIIYWHQAL